MLLVSLLLFLVGFLNLLVGVLVLTRDYRKLQNILFFVFSLSLGGWVIGIGGFLLTNDSAPALVWAKAYYSFPLLIAASMPLFARSFPLNSKIPLSWWLPIVLFYLAVAVPLVVFKDFLTAGLVYHPWGKEILLDKADYLLYSIFLLGCFGVGLGHTLFKSRKLRGVAALQTRFFFIGFLLTSGFGVLFNLIYPFFGNYRLIWLGPLFTNAFLLATGYSILRHKMFDIRAVIARSLSYIATLILVATLYGSLVFGSAQLLFNVDIPFSTQVFLSIATGVASLSFGRVKKAFDRLTNRYFYRDAYEPQELFDRLNKVLVSTADLNVLLKQSSIILADSLKAQYCVIGIKDNSKTGVRLVGTEKRQFSLEDIAKVRGLTTHIHHTVISAEYLESDTDDELRQLLDKNSIAILVRLTQHVNRVEEGLGYIILGIKKSGNPYSKQDTRVLDTIAKELVIAVQNALRFEEIQNFNLTLQAKVDEATKKVRAANEKLKVLDETKDDFISMASHQLRTPLTSIKGYISMVMDGDAGKINKQQEQMLEQAFMSSQRMVYLIADLLNLSRLKTGKFIIDAKTVNLADVIEQELRQLTETATAKGHTLIYSKPKAFPDMMLDETKVRQVIMNFTDNAIYYTPSGGTIEIQLLEKQNTVEFRVKDNGIGVPKSEQAHMFTKFYRAGNARKARPDGTGLGLFMAKKVIVAQGGALIFDSKEGEGSTFGFIFNKTTPAKAVDKN